MYHHYQDLIHIFNQLFAESYNTRLVRGEDEPIYLPADAEVTYHRILFAHGYFASALHEIAHWCVAGPERRLLEDFGYWYEPDGRNWERQQVFEQVEVRPQAYEWILSVSAGFDFSVSCDNLDGDFDPDRHRFMHLVHAEVMQIIRVGLPPRVRLLSDALRAFYCTEALSPQRFVVK